MDLLVRQAQTLQEERLRLGAKSKMAHMVLAAYSGQVLEGSAGVVAHYVNGWKYKEVQSNGDVRHSYYALTQEGAIDRVYEESAGRLRVRDGQNQLLWEEFADGRMIFYKEGILDRLITEDGSLVLSPEFDEEGRILAGKIYRRDGTVIDFENGQVQQTLAAGERLFFQEGTLKENVNYKGAPIQGASNYEVSKEGWVIDRDGHRLLFKEGALTEIAMANGSVISQIGLDEEGLPDRYELRYPDGTFLVYQNKTISKEAECDGRRISLSL